MDKCYFVHCFFDAEEFYTYEFVTYSSDFDLIRTEVFGFLISSVEIFQSSYGDYFNYANPSHMADLSELNLATEVIEENPHLVWEHMLLHMKWVEEKLRSHEPSHITGVVELVSSYLDSALCDVPSRCVMRVQMGDEEDFVHYFLPILMDTAQTQKNGILTKRVSDVLKGIERWGWKNNEVRLGRLMEWVDLYNLMVGHGCQCDVLPSIIDR